MIRAIYQGIHLFQIFGVQCLDYFVFGSDIALERGIAKTNLNE